MKTETSLKDRIEEAAAHIRSQGVQAPDIAIILGTGLGDLAARIETTSALLYGDIPHFPESTVESHAGRLVFGRLADKKVAAMEGRFHFYEGYTLEQVTFPVRLMRALGAKILVVSNACGAMNLSFKRGDLMVIADHINLMGVNPLIGPNDETLGPRFPDMCEPYDRVLQKTCLEVARSEKIRMHQGVYLGVTGPNLETAAEYRMMRNLGGDVVGMSTVPEVIVAVHAGLRVLGISCVTDLCDPDHLEPVDIAEIIRVAKESEPILTRLVEKTIAKIIL